MPPPSLPLDRVAPGPVGDLPAGVPAAYDVPDVPPTRLLDDAVRDFPDVVAARSGALALTWSEVGMLVAEIARGLGEVGVQTGIVVAVETSGDVRDVLVPLAVWRCGAAVAVPGSTSADDWRAPAHVVVTGSAPPADTAVDADADSADAGTADAGTADAGTADRVPPRDAGLERPAEPLVVTVELAVDEPGWWPPRRRRRTHVAVRPRGVRASATAGTRVASDVVLVTNDEAGERLTVTARALVATAFALRLWIPDLQAGDETFVLRGLGHRDVALTLLPSLLVAGTTVVDDASGEPVTSALDAGATVLVTDGATVLGPWSADALTALRVVLHHGPLDPELAAGLRTQTAARVCEIGGPAGANHLTHAAPVYGRSGGDGPGLAVTNTRAVVVDGTGDPVAAGEVGRLHVAGPQVVVDGWLDTGTDLRITDDGLLQHP